ncbi:hypothetical protein B1H38_11785 [Leptospira borgpetersenii serovar Ballum]|nr:hypothetical protein B1H38_11785 [Leptospira borgpetersenii serovar Ballum]
MQKSPVSNRLVCPYKIECPECLLQSLIQCKIYEPYCMIQTNLFQFSKKPTRKTIRQIAIAHYILNL